MPVSSGTPVGYLPTQPPPGADSPCARCFKEMQTSSAESREQERRVWGSPARFPAGCGGLSPAGCRVPSRAAPLDREEETEREAQGGWAGPGRAVAVAGAPRAPRLRVRNGGLLRLAAEGRRGPPRPAPPQPGAAPRARGAPWRPQPGSARDEHRGRAPVLLGGAAAGWVGRDPALPRAAEEPQRLRAESGPRRAQVRVWCRTGREPRAGGAGSRVLAVFLAMSLPCSLPRALPCYCYVPCCVPCCIPCQVPCHVLCCVHVVFLPCSLTCSFSRPCRIP